MAITTDRPAAASGVFSLGGELPVHQLGFGAMWLTGPGVWGPPADRANAIAVMRKAVDLGVNLIDTAEAYGPGASEEVIREALHPYPAGVVVATKGGIHRPTSPRLIPNGSPEFLRKGVEGSVSDQLSDPMRTVWFGTGSVHLGGVVWAWR